MTAPLSSIDRRRDGPAFRPLRHALFAVVCLLLASCATTPTRANETHGEPLLLLPLEVRGDVSPELVRQVETALRATVRRAGRVEAVPPPPRTASPFPDVRAPLGDEPDPVLATYAAAAGAPQLLAGWIAPLPDGRIAWALRFLAAPPVESVPADASPEASGEVPSTPPSGAVPASSPEKEEASSSRPPDPAPPRTLDRAGGLSRPVTLPGDLAGASARLLAGPPEPSPRGQRTVSDLARRLRARAGLFDACLAERLLAVPDLVGVALLQIVVGPRGEVKDVRLARSSFDDPALEACFADMAERVDFPSGVGGESVLTRRVVWPLPIAAASSD